MKKLAALALITLSILSSCSKPVVVVVSFGGEKVKKEKKIKYTDTDAFKVIPRKNTTKYTPVDSALFNRIMDGGKYDENGELIF